MAKEKEKNMDQFDFYEFAGVLTPGAILLFGLSRVFARIDLPFYIGGGHASGMTLGEVGLFAIYAYVAGHLVQFIGSIIEKVTWKLKGGMPTDWLNNLRKPEEKPRLLSKSAEDQILAKLKKHFGVEASYTTLQTIPASEWFTLVRRVYAAVARAQMAQRVDSFNRTYGLLRGVAAAILIIGICHWYVHLHSDWRMQGVLFLILFVFTHSRMVVFGETYGRELFVQFLEIPEEVAHESLAAS